MIGKSIKTLLIITFILIVTACTEDNKSDPIETAMKLMKTIYSDDYEEFQSLYLDHRNTEATKELFSKLKEINDSKANFESYSLIKLGNGEMILVNHTPGKDFEVQDVIILTDEFKKIFEDEITKN
ncbi:hypothetical protein ACX1C1_19690 [Paenibacillus sp. strain BS8-2]